LAQNALKSAGVARLLVLYIIHFVQLSRLPARQMGHFYGGGWGDGNDECQLCSGDGRYSVERVKLSNNPSGAKHAAEKGADSQLDWPNRVQQGLKPIDFIGFIGTTEVVPCYKAHIIESFRTL
jgi:hypothetical protein